MKLKIGLWVLVVVILVGAFIMLKPKSTGTSGTTASPSAAESGQSATTKTVELVVKGRKLVSGPETITATHGQPVVIKITADEDEELHLHGYDKSVELQRDKPAELRFTADTTGNFPYELEHSKTDLGSLQVQPK